MKRIVSLAVVASALAVVAPGAVRAQATIILGAGATIPMSEYADYAKLGWLGHAGVEFPAATNVAVGVHGFYGSNSHDYAGDKTNLYGGVGTVGYTIPTSGSVMPQIWGGAGYMVHSYKSEDFPAFEGSDGSLAALVGAGLGFPLGSVAAALNVYFLTGFGENDETRYLGIDLGVGIPLGGGGM
jgi:hypothetical protein